PFPPAGTAVARAPRPPRPRRVPAPPPAARAAGPAPAAHKPVAPRPAAPWTAPWLSASWLAAPRPTARKPGGPRPAAHQPLPATATIPDDDLFGPSGLRHPFVWLVASGALVLQGGALGGWAVIMAVASLIAAVRRRGRDLTAFTVLLALTLAAGLIMAGLIVHASDSVSPPVRVDAVVPPDPPAPPEGLRPPLGPALQPLTDLPGVGDLAPFLVPELRSVSSSSVTEEMPEPVSTKDTGLADVDVRLLDRHPRLANEADAARALSISYARYGGAAGVAETAVFWVLVEVDGGVLDWRMISTTSPAMEWTARTTMSYLRYEPGMKDGVPYPAWVVQRFVIVP
ncbi:MAG: hypothetical protein ACJ8J0_19435, partial [Longimicrobiaceae bacterium]